MKQLAWCGVLCGATIISVLGGCTSPQTIVLQRPHATAYDSTIRVVRVRADVDVDTKLQDAFEARLRDQLMQQQLFETQMPGDQPLTLEYRFVHKEAGSSSVRVTAGVASLLGSPFYGLGDGAVGVEVTYRNASGELVGRLVADSPISGAFASEKGAVIEAASAIAKYTLEHYKPMVEGRVVVRWRNGVSGL